MKFGYVISNNKQFIYFARDEKYFYYKKIKHTHNFISISKVENKYLLNKIISSLTSLHRDRIPYMAVFFMRIRTFYPDVKHILNQIQ